jgi:hypothetical protein
MTKNYFRFLLLSLLAFAGNANAQCSSCTVTISAADAAPHIIASGQTYCVTSSGSMSGPITIQSGGTLCNQGTITSGNIWVNGGTLTNYGTINTTHVLVDTQGDFSNHQTATIDSLLVMNIYTTFTNSGMLTGTRLAFSDYSSGTNDGGISEDYIGDSLAQFTNNPSGDVLINYDLYNAYNSGFFNHGFTSINRDFFNSTGSTFETYCVMDVGRDWYNSAIVLGMPTPGCAGFDIAGGSYNSGTIGSSTNHVDICDAGNPPFGMDGPGGTIASTTTYCTCSNTCYVVGIAEHISLSDVAVNNIYPNPAKDNLNIEFSTASAEKLSVEVMDMMGRKHSVKTISASAGLNKATLDVSALAAGTYILMITDSRNLSVKQMFTVVK